MLEVRQPREGPSLDRDETGLLVAMPAPSADQQFAAAFHAWGVEVDREPTAEVAQRFRARPATVVEAVVAALDEWVDERRHQGRQAEAGVLTRLATALEEPSSSHGELRSLLASGRLMREHALGMLSRAFVPLYAVPLPFDPGLGEGRASLRKGAATRSGSVLGVLTVVRALRDVGDNALAEQVLRSALQARPQSVVLRNALGQFLEQQQRWPEAVVCYEVTRALRPDLGVALARTLVRSGQIEQGLSLFDQLQSERPDHPWLPFAHGDTSPAERLTWAALCRKPVRRLYVTAFRLSDEAFALEPKRAENFQAEDRYRAACSAVLAAAGTAEDGKCLPDRVVLMLRHRALGWLRADRALAAELVQKGGPTAKEVRQRLAGWQSNAELASVREKAALDRLPADEREQWQQLWAEVEALRKAQMKNGVAPWGRARRRPPILYYPSIRG